MLITSRERIPFLLFAALVVACRAPQLLGAEPWPSKNGSPGNYAQSARTAASEPLTVIDLDGPKQVGVIIELRAAPLLGGRESQDLQLASAVLDAVTEQLRTDLARIEGEARGRVASDATDVGAIRHTYRLTFAGASARVSRESLGAIRALPYVRAVHVDRKVEAHLTRSVPHVGVPQVWQQYGRRGKGVVVAILDTGIDYNHWALGEGFGAGHKVVGGWDFVNNDADPIDDHGHGSHVAGIVAANHKSLTGVAPEATLLAYKILDLEGVGSLSLVLAGVERAIDPNGDGDPSDHADVVNMSLGSAASPDDPVIAAVERGAAAGVVFCVSAGNTGVLAGLGSPAQAPSAITVAASDLEDSIAPFSTGGPVGGTWSLKPEIAAPGVKIVSAMRDQRTAERSGTSMAAPHVSGVAALLIEAHPDWTPADVKAAIVSTAKPITGREVAGSNTPGNFIAYGGAGRIDALAAMAATILPAQPAATFGIVVAKDQMWTASTTVSFTNRGTSSETFALRPPTMPTGAKLTVTPETFTIDPGGTATLQLALEVAKDAQPNDSDVLLAGFLEFEGDGKALRMPWTILKADVLRVTFTGDEEFQIFMSNGNDPAVIWPEGPRTYATLIPEYLNSDILIFTPGSATTDPGLILREQQIVDGFTDITISPDEAKYRVVIDGVDERGVPLDQIAPDATGRLYHRFTLPSGRTIEVTREHGRALRISNSRLTIFRTYETRLAGTDRYFGAYRHLRNVTHDELLTLRPADWASQKIRILCSKPDCTASVGAGLGSFVFFTYHPYPPGTSEFTLHLTPLVDPRYDFRAYVIVRDNDFPPSDRSVNPWVFISNSLRNVNGRFSTSPFGRVSGGEYFPPDRQAPLVLGDGPPILRTAAGASFVLVEPYGPMGEAFGGDDARDVDVKIERLDGPVTVYPVSKSLFLVRQQPGTYRLAVSDEYRIAGRLGRLTQTSNYDTHAAPGAPPSLSSLRIENGRGVATTTLKAGSPSRIVFAARQSLMTGQADWLVNHSPVDAGATQVWWRRHGTADWIPLSVVNTGEDYSYASDFPGSPGTLFTASLAPATAVEGEVDLKFFVKNLLGDTTEAVYEPAFVVGPAGTRRRAMR